MEYPFVNEIFPSLGNSLFISVEYAYISSVILFVLFFRCRLAVKKWGGFSCHNILLRNIFAYHIICLYDCRIIDKTCKMKNTIVLLLLAALLVACEKEGEEGFSIIGKKYAYSPQTVKYEGEYVYYVYLSVSHNNVEKQVRAGSPTGRLVVDIEKHPYVLNYPSLSVDEDGVTMSYNFITKETFRGGGAEYNLVK